MKALEMQSEGLKCGSMEWDHVRIFLAVARSGQLLAASRTLGLNHATVGRQLNALEEELQTKLLKRSVNGCSLTLAGETMLRAAEKVESEFLQLEAMLSGGAGVIRGTVRIAAPDGLGNYFLAPSLADLSSQSPDFLIQLVPLRLSSAAPGREADIVITLDRPTQEDLTVQKLMDYSSSLYASEEYILSNPPITQTEDLRSYLFITHLDDNWHALSHDLGLEISAGSLRRFECGSVVGQIEAVRAGKGIALLHDYVARPMPNLKRVLPGLQLVRSYWLASQPDIYRSRLVTQVRRYIFDAANASREIFCPWGQVQQLRGICS